MAAGSGSGAGSGAGVGATSTASGRSSSGVSNSRSSSDSPKASMSAASSASSAAFSVIGAAGSSALRLPGSSTPAINSAAVLRWRCTGRTTGPPASCTKSSSDRGSIPRVSRIWSRTSLRALSPTSSGSAAPARI